MSFLRDIMRREQGLCYSDPATPLTKPTYRLPVRTNGDGDYVCAVCRQTLAEEGDDEFTKELKQIINRNADKHMSDCPVRNLTY